MNDKQAGGDINTGDNKGIGIAVGHEAKAHVGSDSQVPGRSRGREAITPPSQARQKLTSKPVVLAGAMCMVATIAAVVLLTVGVVDLAIAGFILAALSVGAAAVSLLRG